MKFLDESGLSRLWIKIKELLATKANTADVYTKAEVDALIAEIRESVTWNA